MGRGGGALFQPSSLEPAYSLGLPLAQADPSEAAPPVRARQRQSLAIRRGQSLRLRVVMVEVEVVVEVEVEVEGEVEVEITVVVVSPDGRGASSRRAAGDPGALRSPLPALCFPLKRRSPSPRAARALRYRVSLNAMSASLSP